MDNPPSSDTNNAGAPEAEPLQARTDEGASVGTSQEATTTPVVSGDGKKVKRRTYRPSHKATFIALGVVVVILVVNAAVLGFVLKGKSKTNDKLASGQVSISSDVLKKIGVDTTAIGTSGVELVVDPNAKFNGKVVVAGDVDISGQFKLSNKLVAGEAGITRLTAGDTSLQQLDVNGNTTVTNLNIRSGLIVVGTTQLQGAVTIGQLLTVNGNLNVSGNVAVGGNLTVGHFTSQNLVAIDTLTIGGHVITSGSTPNVGPGTGLGSNGTVSISGNDSAGTLALGIGVGASGGTIASVAFKTQYARTPRIVITAVGVAGNFYLSTSSVGGFTVAVGSGLPPGGYSINYIVMQ